MSDQKVPTAPDYSPIINAYNAIAQHATTQGNAAYDWAKGQVANNQNIVDQVNNGDVNVANTFQNAGTNMLSNGQAIQNDATGYLRNERNRYSDPAYVANDMGAAEATAGQSFDAARNSNIQELESYGVNPGATRFGGMDLQVRLQKAAAQAAAGTGQSNADRQMADSTNDKLLNQGNTSVNQGNTTAATGTNAGTSAVANGTTQAASGANLLGTDLAWTGVNSNALSGQTNATNTGFQNQATSDKMSNDSSSGLGALAGLGLSAFGKGGAFASGGALAPVMGMIGLKEGGAIPDAADGGQIPPSASPSGGAVTDDVAASAPGQPNIRLNGGEMIIPKDVANFLGEKFFRDQIAKARKVMQSEGQPTQRGPVGPVVGGTPGGNPPGGQGPMERTAYMSGGTIASFNHNTDDIEDRRDFSRKENKYGHSIPRSQTPMPQPRPKGAGTDYDDDYQRGYLESGTMPDAAGAIDIERMIREHAARAH